MQSWDYRDDAAPSVLSSIALREALQSYDSLFEHLPVAACAFDRHGVLFALNGKAAELWGRSPNEGEADLFRTFRMFDGEGRSPEIAINPLRAVLSTGLPARDCEMLLDRPDGIRLVLLVNVNPVRDRDGDIVGAVACFQDITELKRVQQALAGREQWFQDLLQSLPTPIYTTDPQGRVTFYNKAAAEFAGREPEVGVDEWCVSWRLRSADGRPLAHDQCPMAQAIKENRPVRGGQAIAERPDGTRAPFMAFPTPLQDGDGALIGAVNMLVDITDRKQAEQQHRAMLAELNHRVKNTLATVLSIAQQTLRTTPDVKSFSASFEARVLALCSAHDLLSQDGWTGAKLREVVGRELALYVDEESERAVVDGPNVMLQPRVVLALGMVLHELAANAARHGALSTNGGRVEIRWGLVPEERGASQTLQLDWCEAGGPQVSPPDRRGVGLRLIEHTVSRDLNGRLQMDYAPDGLKCRIELPVWSGPPT
jgi:PAS domain S-box-containing protein